MNYYLLVFLYLIFANCFGKSDKDILKKLSSLEMMVFVLFIFSAFRGNGNGDYFNYLSYSFDVNDFNDVIFPRKGYPMELLYRVLSYIKNIFSLPSQFIIISMSLLSLTILYLVIKKYSTNHQLSILLYYPFFLIFDMHHSRSGLALNIGLLMFYLLYDDDLFAATVMFLFAMSVHRTSIVLIFFYFSKVVSGHFYLSKKYAAYPLEKVFLLCFYILIIGNFSILNASLQFINTANLKVDYFQVFIEKALTYINDPIYGYSFSMLDPRFLIMVLTYVLIVILYDYQSESIKKELPIYFFSLILMVLLSENTIMTMRIPAFFSIVKIVMIPNFWEDIKIKYPKSKLINYLFILLIIVFILLCIILSLRQVPYRFFNLKDQWQF